MEKTKSPLSSREHCFACSDPLVYAKGLCKMHYHRQYRTGKMGPPHALPHGSSRLKEDDVRALRLAARRLLAKARDEGIESVSLVPFVREQAKAAGVNANTIWRALKGQHFTNLDVPPLTQSELDLIA